MSVKKLLEDILKELRGIHYHQDRMEVFYKMVNRIREDEKTGVWIEEKSSEDKKE